MTRPRHEWRGFFLGSVRSKAAKVKALMIVAVLVAGTSFTVSLSATHVTSPPAERFGGDLDTRVSHPTPFASKPGLLVLVCYFFRFAHQTCLGIPAGECLPITRYPGDGSERKPRRSIV